ncbi:hypothetical protein [Streptomyces platensis]|uniref:hypothetical protein n=1 Tax=Streptomyces platensis TaxID=58346 RepID=UPI002F9071FA|nr:hypothetical protein OG962_37365 [Streptomyces platensis]
MNVTRRPAASLATEHLDTETLALLDAVAVELPDFGPVDLDIAFGTPLDMWEPAGPRRGMARHAAAAAARWDAARDIVASDPSITVRVRERLVDVLLPYAAQLRIAPPATEPLPFAA